MGAAGFVAVASSPFEGAASWSLVVERLTNAEGVGCTLAGDFVFQEDGMMSRVSGRRDFLVKATTLAGLQALGALLPRELLAAAAETKVSYNPAAKLDVTITEVELRRNAAGRMLMARVYQPAGAGPFPTMLDLHGGAWNAKDRFAEEPMDRAIASSGVLVVAVDLTRAPEAPYPASVQDANYALRWLKWKAPTWKGDPSAVGTLRNCWPCARATRATTPLRSLLAHRLSTRASPTSRCVRRSVIPWRGTRTRRR
jgi:hypothetical protein